MTGGGEPGHVQARLGDDRHRQLAADAGNLREPFDGRQYRCVLATADVRSPLGVGAPGGGDGVQGGLDLVLKCSDGLVQVGGAVQVEADEHGEVTRPESPGHLKASCVEQPQEVEDEELRAGLGAGRRGRRGEGVRGGVHPGPG